MTAHPTSPSTTSSSSKAPLAASPAEGVSGELIDLLREARAYVPSLTLLATRIDVWVARSCVFCHGAGHLSMDCRAFRPTGKQP